MNSTTLLRLMFALFAVAAFAAVFDFASGALVFLAFHEIPRGLRWDTLHAAWAATAADPVGRHKVRGAVMGGGMAAVAFVGGLLFLIESLKPQKALHGSARFARIAEVFKGGLLDKTGVVLGRLNGKLLRFSGPEFILLAAPTRSGKGVSFVIPNLLVWEQSVVVLDIKAENYNLTSRYRKQYLDNDIFIFNPFQEQSHACNFLSYVSSDRNFRVNDLQALAVTIYPADSKNPFWSDQARNLFVALGLLVLETPELPHTIGEMLRQATGKGQPLPDYLKQVVALREAAAAPLSDSCIDSINRFLQGSEETVRNIISSFTAPLAIFQNPVVDKATSRDDFDLRDLRKKKITLYVNIAAADVASASFVLNMLFSLIIGQNVKELPEQNPALKYQCLLLMDEFTAAGKIAAIAKGVGFMAGYNMRLAIIIQDRAQLESESGYGKSDAQNILSNMGATVYFTPRTQQEAENYSKLLGNETVKRRQRTRSFGGSGRSSGSETEVEQARALMLPQELRAMDLAKELIQRSGMPIVLADKITYYKDPFFTKRLQAVDQTAVMVDGSERTVPLPLDLPGKGWMQYQVLVSRSDYYVKGDLSDLHEDGATVFEKGLATEGYDDGN